MWSSGLLSLARIDLSPPHRPPEWWRVVMATILSVVPVSLAVDALLVVRRDEAVPDDEGLCALRIP
jgi:hypothetical protein